MPPASDSAIDLFDRAGNLVSTLGNDAFDPALVDLLDGAASFHQFILFAVPREGDTHCVYSWNRASQGLVTSLSQRYVEGKFYKIDPTLRYLRQIVGPARKVHLLRHREITDLSYRRSFFEAPELDAKMSILEENASEGLYLNFYKRTGEAEFSEQEVANLSRVAGLVCKSILHHRVLTKRRVAAPALPDLATVRTMIASQAPALTIRELDVCARVVAGYSTEAIALDLVIGESSVATYRKRAYAKLGICSQHELFALCLQASRAN